jgi:PAS domain S-box-containing protein
LKKDFADLNGSIKKKDTGKHFHVDISLNAIKINGTTFVYAILKDIEKYKQEIENTEKTFQLIAENSGDVIWTMDIDQNTTYVSPSITKLTGYTIEEHLSHSSAEQLTEESNALAQNLYKTFFNETGHPVQFPGYSVTLEMQYRCKDGSKKWTEVKVNYLLDEAGEIIGLHGATRDIEKRKQIEINLKESRQQLIEAQRWQSLGVMSSTILMARSYGLMKPTRYWD